MMTLLIRLSFLLAITSLAACSAEQAYYGVQFSQKNQCQKYLPNDEDYQRCIESNNISYEVYEHRRQELKTSP